MRFPLPVTKQEAEVREFVPHGVYARFQAAAMKGVKIDIRAGGATKEELLVEFGAEEMRALDSLPPGEHEKKLKSLKEEYVKRHTDLSGVTLADAEEANLVLLEGMVISLGGSPASRDALNALPELDYQTLLQRVTTVANDPLGQPSAPPPGV